MNTKKLQFDHLNKQIDHLSAARVIPNLPSGWVRAIRLALGMPLRELADKLSVTKQSVYELERRETDGTITLNSLRKAADAMDMELVYGLVPRSGSLKSTMDTRMRKIGHHILGMKIFGDRA